MKPAKLFHAVVITGAALTGCAGGNKKPTTTNNQVKADNTAPQPTKAEEKPGECPPGSELPYPPCFLIL